MLELICSSMLVLIQACSSSIGVRIFLSLLVLLITFVLLFSAHPYQFQSNNVVALNLKFGVLEFLMLAAYFIDQASVSAADLADSQRKVGIYAVTVLCVVTAVSVCAIVRWAMGLVVRRSISSGSVARLALLFRDSTVVTGLISNVD